MASTEQLAKQAYDAGGWSFSQYKAAGGSFGDYYWNAFNRAYNKLVRAAEAAEKDAFAAENAALIATLFEQTKMLKVEYLQRVGEWAAAEFGRMITFVADVAARPRITYGENGYKEQRKLREKAERLTNRIGAGEANFVTREIENAEQFYTDSIHKLAARIDKKGLNKSAITIKTARVKQNIETTFTDGVLTVRAWTIIASGPVQRPHYRYLIK